MLVRFNVKNFLSFDERIEPDTGKSVSHEFSMLPGKVRLNADHVFKNKNQNLLRMAAIYGANASGKSNVVKAFKFFQKKVTENKFSVGFTEKYCKIDIKNKDKPSYFEIEILIGDELYAYGFELLLSEGAIISEWLTKLSKGASVDLFFKNGKDDSYHFCDYFSGNQALEIYQQGIAGSDTLFLFEMNSNKQGFYSNNPDLKILKQVYDWIADSLEIINPTSSTKDASFLINSTALSKVAELLDSFGTGIVSVKEINVDVEKIFDSLPIQMRRMFVEQVEHLSLPKKNNEKKKNKFEKLGVLIRNRNDIVGVELTPQLKLKAYSVQFQHKNIDSKIHFKISEESDGTARLFELIEILLSGKEKTYIVDELDRCLHPCLTYKFIQNFFEYTRQKRVQLIITTHESRLLDFDLLRRDEIWFVDKDKTGNSNIYSLEEYNTRFDQKIDKAYLEGRYGGVPVFTTLFPLGEQDEGK